MFSMEYVELVPDVDDDDYDDDNCESVLSLLCGAWPGAPLPRQACDTS